MDLETYLSKYVYKIIVEYGQNIHPTKNYITNSFTYNWKKFESSVGEINDDFSILDQPDSWYDKSLWFVWDALHSAGVEIETASTAQRETIYQQCEWVACPQTMAEFHKMSEVESDVGTLIAVLHLTSAFERALGNVYSTKNHPVPFLLRDLLNTQEIKTTFGKVPIMFTQLILGCPKGLNLRNVVWHGFISPGELHSHLVGGLLVLFASLGQLLPSDQVLPKRPQFALFEHFFNDLQGVYPNFASNSKEVEAILDIFLYVPTSNKPYWRKAFKCFQEKRFGDSLVLLMPLLEHCLRFIYCKVNDCQPRLLTAESTSLYTTLDEILAPSCYPLVGDGLLMMLIDLNSSLSGPRLRDKLSHGECDLSSLPEWVVNHVFGIALSTAHLQDSHTTCGISMCSSLRTACLQYHSKFHVVTNLRHHMKALLKHWAEHQHCAKCPDDQLKTVSCCHISTLNQLLFPQTRNLAEKVDKVNECLENLNLQTLYRPRTELELAARLLSIVKNISETAAKIRTAVSSRLHQWNERTLRSRARVTCQRMWSVLPDLWTSLLCVLMIISLCYRNLPAIAQEKSVFRLTKCINKTVENTVNLCDEEKNRWTEAHQILSALSKSILQWIQENKNIVSIPLNCLK